MYPLVLVYRLLVCSLLDVPQLQRSTLAHCGPGWANCEPEHYQCHSWRRLCFLSLSPKTDSSKLLAYITTSILPTMRFYPSGLVHRSLMLTHSFMQLSSPPSPKKSVLRVALEHVSQATFPPHRNTDTALKLTMVGEKLLIFMSFIHIRATSLLDDSFFTVPLLTSAERESQFTFQNKISISFPTVF